MRLFGSPGKKAVRAVPGAKRIELKGIGHMPQVEAVDAYMTASLDFPRWPGIPVNKQTPL